MRDKHNEIYEKIDLLKKIILDFLDSYINDDAQNLDTETLRRFVDSFLPRFKSELQSEEELLDQIEIFNIINQGIKSILVQIKSIINSGDSFTDRYDKILKIALNGNNLLRDFYIVKALNVNLSNKIEKAEQKLIKDYNERYESEVKAVKLALKTRFDDNNKSLENLFEFYKKELQEIRNNQFDDKREKDKAFIEFMDETVQTKDKLVEKFENSFSKIQTDWKKIQQIKTENVYLNAYHKNTARSKNSESKFIGVTVFSLILSLITIIAFIFKAIDFSQFISIKIMIVVFFGILIAYYLKISTHYRRLADQAEQTHLELLAFPQYAAELGEEKSNEIKEQLALKYFGKEIDPSGYQKIGEIAQEQLKTSAELVKAAASITQGNAARNQNNPSTSDEK